MAFKSRGGTKGHRQGAIDAAAQRVRLLCSTTQAVQETAAGASAPATLPLEGWCPRCPPTQPEDVLREGLPSLVSHTAMTVVSDTTSSISLRSL